MTGWAALAACCAGVATLPARPSPARRAAIVTRSESTGGRSPAPAAVALLLLVAAAAVSSIYVVVAAVGAVVVAAVVRRVGLARSRRERAAACIELVFALAAELRAGQPPAQALAAAGQSVGVLTAEVELAMAEMLSAGSAAAVVERLSATPGCEALRGVSAAWFVTERVGGPVADVLDRLGASLDATADVAQTMHAALAGPRSTVALLACLPALGMALGQSVGAHPLTLLLHRPLGWALGGGAAVLEIVGMLWTRAIVSRVAR